MKKIERSDLPRFTETGLTRRAACSLFYTEEEYAVISAGFLAEEISDLYNIFEENGKLYFVDRSENKLSYRASFEPRGAGRVLGGLELEDDDATRLVFPGDINAAWMPWMLIEDKLLRRFPKAEWEAYMEDFRMTPDVDDPAVPMTTPDRAFIFACRTFLKKHARMA